MTQEVARQDPGLESRGDLGSVVSSIERLWAKDEDPGREVTRGLDLASRYLELVGAPRKDENAADFYDAAIKSCTEICDRIRDVGVRMGKIGDYKNMDDLLRMEKTARLALDGLVVRKICHIHNMDGGSAAVCPPEGLSHMPAEDAGTLGRALAGMGRYGEAERFLECSDDAEYDLANMYDDMGMHYKASALFDMSEEDGDDDHLLCKGIALAHAGSYRDALESLGGVKDDDGVAAYYMAYSWYRLGEYERAADLYGTADDSGVFADAMRMQLMMDDMDKNVQARIRLPLLAADVPGGFRGMPELQYAVYMAQQQEGVREYDFEHGGFGPYSADLELDILSNTRLFSVEAGGIFDGPRVCSITQHGRDHLSKLTGSSDPGTGSLLAKYSKTPQAELVDLVYGAFTSCPDPGPLVRELEDARDIARSRIDAGMHPAFEYVNLHAGHARSILGGADEFHDAAKKRAVTNIAGLVAHACGRVRRHAGPPVDHARLRTALADLEESGRLLFKYCSERGVVEYPRISAGIAR
ncbi:MAG: hypothetical protein MPJ08_01175 [Nitrosopumilus sp.]|nr:hypothetical protein [Nitrosopumilus sp.]